MSSRYEDTRTDREANRRASFDRAVDDREPGQGIRRDVRQTGQNIRNAGGDIVSNLCGLWGNLLGSVGDAISPQSRSTRSANESSRVSDDANERSSGFFGCEGAEFRISCGPSGSEADQGDDRDNPEKDKDKRTRARYADRDREIDVTT
jgi:hypothetical protein